MRTCKCAAVPFTPHFALRTPHFFSRQGKGRKMRTRMAAAGLLGFLCLLTHAWAAENGGTPAKPNPPAAPTLRPAATATRTGLIAEGSAFQTPYWVVDSGTEGPKVLVTGGIHGNEPAGTEAADEIRYWPLAKGRLILVPRCNVPGLEAGTREAPGEPKELTDLNRNFPLSGKEDTAHGPMAKALWAFVREHRPDYVLDLHEGSGVRSAGSESVGSSIIRVPHPETAALQDLMLAAVNATVADAEKRFARLRGGADGSLARACGERLGARAFIVETTYKDQPLALRVRQHRIVVHALLKHLGMVAGDASGMVPQARPTPATVYAAIYDGPGTSSTKTPPRFERILTPAADVLLRRIAPEDIRDGALAQFDTVIFAGGSGSGQANGLQEGGREAVRKFILGGGGYVGICAGAYLATSNYTWSLAVVNGDSIDREHWRRGNGQVEIELTPRGREFFNRPAAARLEIRFAQGPILAPGRKEDLPPYAVLAWYRTGIGQNGADPKTMIDTPAIVTGECGKGRVIVFSPHPEQTDGLHDLLLRAVRWTARREATPQATATGPQGFGGTDPASDGAVEPRPGRRYAERRPAPQTHRRRPRHLPQLRRRALRNGTRPSHPVYQCARSR